jgi:hypothetical protein
MPSDFFPDSNERFEDDFFLSFSQSQPGFSFNSQIAPAVGDIVVRFLK